MYKSVKLEKDPPKNYTVELLNNDHPFCMSKVVFGGGVVAPERGGGICSPSGHLRK